MYVAADAEISAKTEIIIKTNAEKKRGKLFHTLDTFCNKIYYINNAPFGTRTKECD